MKAMSQPLPRAFFARPAFEVAPDLIGKKIVRRTQQGEICLRITETEAYYGTEDTACHAHKGKTPRTRVLWEAPGTLYIYLCYGMHWMLNVVTGEAGHPEAVLIRACKGADGPGKLTRACAVTHELNGKSVLTPDAELVFEDDGVSCETEAKPRVGIGYAARADQERLWRFCEKAGEKNDFI